MNDTETYQEATRKFDEGYCYCMVCNQWFFKGFACEAEAGRCLTCHPENEVKK